MVWLAATPCFLSETCERIVIVQWARCIVTSANNP